jgi:hypothetical protein
LEAVRRVATDGVISVNEWLLRLVETALPNAGDVVKGAKQVIDGVRGQGKKSRSVPPLASSAVEGRRVKVIKNAAEVPAAVEQVSPGGARPSHAANCKCGICKAAK